jgi:hypothetical protein
MTEHREPANRIEVGEAAQQPDRLVVDPEVEVDGAKAGLPLQHEPAEHDRPQARGGDQPD